MAGICRLLLIIAISVTLIGCTIGQRKLAVRTGATYGTVKVLKEIEATPEQADQIAEIARLALSSDREEVRAGLEKIVKAEFDGDEQVLLLGFLDDLANGIVELSEHDGEVVVLIKATAEGVILGVTVYKRSLSGQLVPVYVV